MDLTKDTVMPGAWAVIGHDRFDDSYYPKGVLNIATDARAAAALLNEEQPAKQPGGLHDVFEAMPLGKAAMLCGMTVEQFIAFVATVQIEATKQCPHCKGHGWFDVDHPGMPDGRVLQVRCRCQSPYLAYRTTPGLEQLDDDTGGNGCPCGSMGGSGEDGTGGGPHMEGAGGRGTEEACCGEGGS